MLAAMTSPQLPWQPDTTTPVPMIANLEYGRSLHTYSTGFRDGAAVLLEALQDNRYGQERLVYPLVYCLRHSLELALKHVIREARNLLDEDGDFPDGHNLRVLWASCRPILRRIWPDDDKTYRTVGAAVEALSAIDAAGEGFRYPVSTKSSGVRAPTIDPQLRRLDIEKLSEDVVAVLELLEGADAGLDAYADAKADMLAERRELEAEMRAEYEAEIREYAAEMRAEYEAEIREHGAAMRAEYAAEMATDSLADL